MRLHPLQAFALAAALILAACAPREREDTPEATPPAAGDVEADTGAIGQVRDRFIAAINDGDVEAIAALWTENGALMPPDQPAAVGKEAIRAWYQGMFSQMDADIDIRPAETRVVGDAAFERGTFTLTLAPKAPGTAATPPPAGGGASPSPSPGAATGRPPGPAAADVVPPAAGQTMKYVVVLRRDGGAWRVAYNIWNVDTGTTGPAGAGAAEAARAPGAPGTGGAGAAGGTTPSVPATPPPAAAQPGPATNPPAAQPGTAATPPAHR